MKRAVGFLVFIALLGGAVWIGLGASGGPLPLPAPTASPSYEQISEHRWHRWPASARVRQGVEYVYETGHCGLRYELDFDGSMWVPINPNSGRQAPSFFINYDKGTIVLVDEDTARYTASTGGVVELRRLPGPAVTYNCA